MEDNTQINRIYRELVAIRDRCGDPDAFLSYLRAAAEMLGTSGQALVVSPDFPA